MIPMVDVVMVILIFFMASTSFVGTEWFLRAAIPRQAEAAEQPEEGGDPFRLPPARFEVLLRVQEGQTHFTGRALGAGPLQGLSVQLQELARDASGEELILIIRAEANVPYADVIRAHEAAAAAGIERIGIMDAQ